jgi:hypothetical protein
MAGINARKCCCDDPDPDTDGDGCPDTDEDCRVAPGHGCAPCDDIETPARFLATFSGVVNCFIDQRFSTSCSPGLSGITNFAMKWLDAAFTGSYMMTQSATNDCVFEYVEDPVSSLTVEEYHDFVLVPTDARLVVRFNLSTRVLTAQVLSNLLSTSGGGECGFGLGQFNLSGPTCCNFAPSSDDNSRTSCAGTDAAVNRTINGTVTVTPCG